MRLKNSRRFRTVLTLEWLEEEHIALEDLIAVVGIGGLLRPMTGGTYEITPEILMDFKRGYEGQHASNLDGVIAYEIAKKLTSHHL